MNPFFRKLRWLTRRSEREAELREELEFHLDEEARQRQAGGFSQADARWAARRDIGNLALVSEDTRAAWGWPGLEQLVRDAGYGLRQLRRSPVFSAIAIATLALGIGGVTAMFSVFDAALLRPLPYVDGDRLVMIWDDMTGEGRSGDAPAPAEVLEWRRHNTVFTDLAATQPGEVALSGDGEPEQVAGRKATASLWKVLGVTPRLGRVFTEREDETGVRVVVISHGLWQRRYGASPDVLGRKIIVNDAAYEVIGVMPREFYFMPARDIDIWLPASFPQWMRTNFTWHDAQVVARLRPGVTLARAQESMSALSTQVTKNDFRGPHSGVVKPLREEMLGKTQTALIALLCASAALLLIACANLANLLMSRGAARDREVAVRSALGAGRGRLIAQFLTESLVLASLGAAAGVALAAPAMRFLETLLPETMGEVRLTLDWRLLAFSAAGAMIAALTFGLAPAIRASSAFVKEGLRDGGRGTTGRQRHRLQDTLIVIETALAVTLLTTGGLLLQAFEHLANTDLGIRTENLLTFETPLYRYKDFHRRVAFVNMALEQVRALPGVVNAAAISRLPLTASDQATFYVFRGQSPDKVAEQVALFRVVTRDYFSAVDARLREGRFFEITDRQSVSPVVIVNESFANKNFPARSAIGAQFKFGQLDDTDYWYTVVGVVKGVRDVGIADQLKPAVYLLHEQTDQWVTSGAQPNAIVVRTDVAPASIVSSVRRAIWSVDKDQPIWRVQTFEQIVDRQLSTSKQSTGLMSAFAVLALLLASLGIYGVLSYAVAQRTKEIGVRMALGANSGEILLAFSTRGLTLTLAGLGIGLLLALVASQAMTGVLYGIRPAYVPTAVAVSLILMTVAALACLIPACRASRVDPMVALRDE